MKNIFKLSKLVLLTLISISTPSVYGNEIDSTSAIEIHNAFKDPSRSRAPRFDELKFGNDWSCMTYSTQQNTKYTLSYHFTQKNGYILDLVNEEKHFGYYYFGPEFVSHAGGPYNSEKFIKVTTDGKLLLVEYVGVYIYLGNGLSTCSVDSPDSVADRGFHKVAIGYSICKIDFHNKAKLNSIESLTSNLTTTQQSSIQDFQEIQPSRNPVPTYTDQSSNRAPTKTSSRNSNPYCYIQSNNQYQCENTPGCAWIPANHMGSCLGRPGLPKSQTQFCYVNNNNPQNCSNTPFCFYQNNSQPSSCVSR